jgi:hypothetical protein
MSYKGQKDYKSGKVQSHTTTPLGLHSLRSGGATAACNFGVPDRLFKRHGRWRSGNAKDGYVKDSFNDLLFVSKI